ncbi:MAG: hypothetical protein WC679_01975 [Bacteroidales bacterium]|jgi:hypothetical protein
MKIKSIKYNSRKANVYDFETPSHSYILDGGIISHNTQEMYSKTVVSGGTGNIYASDNIFIIGKQQEKEKDGELLGWNFIINIEKSRYTKEKEKIPILVTFEGGLSKYTGMLELAIEAGFVIKPKNARFSRVIDFDTGEIEEKVYKEAETDTDAFWEPILSSDNFRTWVQNKYQISSTNLIQTIEDSTDVDLEDIE